MKISNHQQCSVEWLKARLGIPTASEFDALLTPEFKIRNGEMPKSYLAKKLAEKLTGDYMAGLQTFDMEQGTLMEEEARPWFELETNMDVRKVGLVTTDDGRVGCSPDGLGDGFGVEIKCPRAETHMKYLLNGELPKEYAAQVHGSMYVTGLPTWYFVSYHRKLPKLVLKVKQDPDIQHAIHAALIKFLADFESALYKFLPSKTDGCFEKLSVAGEH